MYPNELTMISEFLNIRKIFAFVSIFIVFSGVHTVVIEFGAVSLYQLMQQNRAHNIYGNGNVIYRNGNSIDIEVPKGRGVQIVPTRLGLFNRAYYPRQINIRLQKPEPDSSSHEKHRRRHSYEDHSGSSDHHKHHKRRQRHRHGREQDDSDHYDESRNRYKHDEPSMENPGEQHRGGHRSQEERRDEYKSGSNESSIREHDDDRHLPYDDDRHRPHDDDNRHRPYDDDRHRPNGDGSYHDNDGYPPDDDAYGGDRHQPHLGDNSYPHDKSSHHGGDNNRPHDDDNRDNPDVSPYDNRDEYGYYDGENNYPYDAYNYDYDHDDQNNRDHSKGQSYHHGHPNEGNRDHSKSQSDHHRHPDEDNRDDHKNQDDPYNHERGDHTSNRSDEEFHDAHETLDDMPQQESHHKLDRRFSLFSPLLSSSDDKDLQTLKPTSDAALDATVPTPTDDTTVSTPSDNIPDAAVSTSIDNTSGLGTSVSVDTSVSTASDDVQSSTNVSLERNNITSEPETTEGSSSTSTTSDATETSATTSTSSSSLFSWLIPEEEPPKYSPYTLLKFLSPTDTSPDSLSSMFSVFSDPTNTSYLQNASTMMRVVLFFMPGTGIVDQVYFTMAISKIMWKAATMYYEGYGEIPIAITVLSDLAYESYLARRDLPASGDDSSIIQKTIIIPGECIDVSNMDVPTFLKYIRNMEYPALTPEQEKTLRYDIDNLVSITYPTISEDLKTSFVDALRDSSKFLALVNVKGDLIADHVDVNFSDVYVSMHAAFDNDSLLDKLMKKVEAVVETIKHIPDLVMDP